jgi:hypothetical protein
VSLVEDSDASLDDSDDGAVGLAVDVELCAYGSDTCLADVDDEGSLAVFGDVKEGLALQEVDGPLVFAVSDADFGQRVELNCRAIAQREGALFAEGGCVDAAGRKNVGGECDRGEKY